MGNSLAQAPDPFCGRSSVLVGSPDQGGAAPRARFLQPRPERDHNAPATRFTGLYWAAANGLDSEELLSEGLLSAARYTFWGLSFSSLLVTTAAAKVQPSSLRWQHKLSGSSPGQIGNLRKIRQCL